MAAPNRATETLGTAFVLSFGVEIAALAAATVGLVAWLPDRSRIWGLWLWVSAAAIIAACKAARWWITRWFRRRWPVE